MAWKPFHALQKRRWDNAYFHSVIVKHPELTVAQAQDKSAWYLMDYRPHPEHPEWNDNDWRWRLVEQFPRTVDQSPESTEYLPLALPVLGGAALAWLLTHTVAWVATGFRIGSGSGDIG